MPFMPFAILGIWFRGLLALGLLGGGIWLLATWYDALPRVTPVVQTDPAGTRPPARPLSSSSATPSGSSATPARPT